MKNFQYTNKKANHIRLHRFVRLGDRADSQVFTFVVPAQLTRGFINIAQSKEFIYGGQRWQLLLCYQLEDVTVSDMAPGFNSVDKPKSSDSSRELNKLQCPPRQKILSNPLNVGVALCGGLAGMQCKLESSRFTVLNRDSFSLNKSHEEKFSTFTADSPVWWKTGWLHVERLAPEGFLFDDWTWLLEVELRGASTIYEECLSLSKAGTRKVTNGKLRFESASFTYAGSDWNVSLEWLLPDTKRTDIITNNVCAAANTQAEKIVCPNLKLHRHSRTNHWCRVRYRTTLVWGNLGESTVGPVDQLITSDSGASTKDYEIGDPKWFGKGIQSSTWGKQRIKIVVEMLAAAPVSRIDLIPIEPLGGKNLARCKDPEGYDWVVRSDILGTLVRLKFFPIVEVHQPTDRLCELRYVSWNVHLIPFQSTRGVVKALSSTYVCHVPTFLCLMRPNNNRLGPPTETKEVINSEEVVEVALDLLVEHVSR
ncbi:unnamed protein product [Schistocephalus solidus]|uniref:TIP41-like protein n=1 Tax=Schistocephalus solidus TaxID=70667 RepID=A0A183T1Q9_SCHSO|nr:unnamed protein product [Schistocephalus solidus]